MVRHSQWKQRKRDFFISALSKKTGCVRQRYTAVKAALLTVLSLLVERIQQPRIHYRIALLLAAVFGIVLWWAMIPLLPSHPALEALRGAWV